MIEVDVRHDLRQVAARFSGQVRAQMRPAIARALNRTATSVRAGTGREIRKVYNIKQGSVRAQIKITRATRNELEARVTASGRPIPLIEFGARQTKRGVTVKVKRRGGRKLIPGAFVATVGAGHRGVFIRAQSGTRTKRDQAERKRVAPKYSDLPIAELLTLSIPKAFTNREVLAALERVARVRFPVEFERELNFLRSRL
jgi:hypothetical protein